MNVEIRETGTVKSGINVARQFCKKDEYNQVLQEELLQREYE